MPVNNNIRISTIASKVLDTRDKISQSKVSIDDAREKLSALSKRPKPNLQNLKVNFNGDPNQVGADIKTALSLINFTNDSSLNIQVKAGFNTNFSLEPAMVFAEQTLKLFPGSKIVLSVRVDTKEKLDFNLVDESQLFSELAEPLQDKIIDLKKLGDFSLRFISQIPSNSAKESKDALIDNYQEGFSHHLEIVHGQALANRCDLGIKSALKELRNEGKTTYANISVLNSCNFNKACSTKEAFSENISELVDTGLYAFTGKIREPGAFAALQKLKYKFFS